MLIELTDSEKRLYSEYTIKAKNFYKEAEPLIKKDYELIGKSAKQLQILHSKAVLVD